MIDFLYMDGYWAYVWSAWGLTAVVMTGMVVAAVRHHRAARRDVAHAPARTAKARVSVTEVTGAEEAP